ncbi:hypothetical protein GCM10009655_24230 [Rhodoglobus aureus]|uniref:Resolvase/invertase-type recombinase catalytic domain-containing protein n=1 Tax=Rhodoglobus aureus TaxID=191497 RepID=A0ABN1VVA3_9MICO
MLKSDADVVITVDLYTLLRSPKDLMVLAESGIRLVTVDGEIDLATTDGELRAGMLAGLAQFEMKRKTGRALRVNAYRISNRSPIAGNTRYVTCAPCWPGTWRPVLADHGSKASRRSL